MRDAELRFDTLRMRIEERSFTARGEKLVVVETAIVERIAMPTALASPAACTAPTS